MVFLPYTKQISINQQISIRDDSGSVMAIYENATAKEQPMAGDIVVIQSYTGGSVHGHIQMYNGTQWVSDFKQSGFWPGSGYRKNEPSYSIFR